MVCGYDRNIVSVVQRLMAGMMDFAVNGLGLAIDEFYNTFLASDFPGRIERGDSRTVMGMSGIEVAYAVSGKEPISGDEMERFIDFNMDRSPEYWTGWALAYFQSTTRLTFGEINDFRSIGDVRRMYPKYHEMDVRQFCDSMKEAYFAMHPMTCLQIQRKQAGISQKMLADMSGIPLKTIQQYEQRRKDINRANVDYVLSMARVMNCDIEVLLEKV